MDANRRSIARTQAPGGFPARGERSVVRRGDFVLGQDRNAVAGFAEVFWRLGRGVQPIPQVGKPGHLAGAVRTAASGRPRNGEGSPDRQHEHSRSSSCGRRAAKKGGAEAQGLGRSRGGFTTKLHLAAADESTAVIVVLTPGQCHDAKAFPAVFGAIPDSCPAEYAVMDKGYDSDEIRDALVSRDIAPVIPSKVNRIEPIEYSEKHYKTRNRVERLIGKLKQFRRVATRYDKLAGTFLAFVQLTATFLTVR
jgi:putative transposase